MLKAATPTEFVVTLPEVLPQDFTIEFDIIPKQCCNPEDLSFEGTATRSVSSASALVSWRREGVSVQGGGPSYEMQMPPDLREALPGALTRVMVVVEGETLKLYTNGRRLFTLTDRRFARGRVLRVFLGGQDDSDQAVYLAGLRIVTGAGSGTIAAAAGPLDRSSSAAPAALTPTTSSTSQAATAAPIAVTGLTVTTDAQGIPTLKWTAIPDVVSYAVLRWNVADLSCCNRSAPPGAISSAQWQDQALPQDGTYAYRVYASTATGTIVGEARVTLKSGAITSAETVTLAGSGTIASTAPPPPAPPPPPPTPLDPTRPMGGTPTLTVMSNAPAPVIAPITGTPVLAMVRWGGAAGAVRFVVHRRYGRQAAVQRTPEPITTAYYNDVITETGTTFQYQVTAYQPDGSYGTSAWVSYTPPPMVNPAGLVARQIGSNEAKLTWQRVDGVTSYRIDGAGLPSAGVLMTNAYLNVPKLPTGVPLSWQVAAVYGENLFDLTTRPVATLTLPATPWRTTPFLTLRNGEGTLADQLAYYTEMVPRPDSCKGVLPWECLSATSMIRGFPMDQAFMNQWSEMGSPTGAPVVEAIFADMRDMGAGRHIFCAQKLPSPLVPLPPGSGTGIETLCWASTHGPMPGAEGWGDPAVTVGAAFNNWPDRGWTFLRQGTAGTLFAAFEGLQGTGGYGDAQYGKAKTESVFDAEGPKRVPHACLACHGGRYDASTRRIVDASMIPIDPTALVFPSQGTHTRAGQEERIRRINMFVLNSNPSPAVAAYIRGLYGGTPEVSGTRARDNYIPIGWNPSQQLYLKVVKPYCQGCHLQQSPRNDFATFENFVVFKGAIQAMVCSQRTMPHAEAPFLAFWRDGKGESLPDYLMTALGLSPCTP